MLLLLTYVMMVTGYWLGEWESIQDRDISRLICFLTNGTRQVKLSWREAHYNHVLPPVSQPFFRGGTLRTFAYIPRNPRLLKRTQNTETFCSAWTLLQLCQLHDRNPHNISIGICNFSQYFKNVNYLFHDLSLNS